MKGRIVVETPEGQIIETKAGKARLTWNPGFGPKVSGVLNGVQAYVDSEVLRLGDPYVPMDTGALKQSGILGTHVGSGLVVYNAPYAREQYYNTADTRGYDPRRGGHWFARMKADHGPAIIAGAKKKAGALK